MTTKIDLQDSWKTALRYDSYKYLKTWANFLFFLAGANIFGYLVLNIFDVIFPTETYEMMRLIFVYIFGYGGIFTIIGMCGFTFYSLVKNKATKFQNGRVMGKYNWLFSFSLVFFLVYPNLIITILSYISDLAYTIAVFTPHWEEISFFGYIALVSGLSNLRFVFTGYIIKKSVHSHRFNELKIASLSLFIVSCLLFIFGLILNFSFTKFLMDNIYPVLEIFSMGICGGIAKNTANRLLRGKNDGYQATE